MKLDLEDKEAWVVLIGVPVLHVLLTLVIFVVAFLLSDFARNSSQPDAKVQMKANE